MIATLALQDNVDLTEVIQWAIDNCASFVEYQVVEIDWTVDRDDRDPWFKLEVTFRDASDVTLFLLRWA